MEWKETSLYFMIYFIVSFSVEGSKKFTTNYRIGLHVKHTCADHEWLYKVQTNKAIHKNLQIS